MSMVEWKKLGEVCEILDNLRRPIAKSQRKSGIYPYYGANGVQDYVENYIFDGTFLLMGEDGSVINEDKSPILHWATGKIWVNNHAHILKETDSAYLRYVYYSLQCADVSDIVRGVPPKINQANLRNIQIPIPSKEEQERIVGILDTFTASIANLKSQIKERRKQYEYYRDQLFDLEGKDGVEMKTIKDVCINICSGGTPSTSHKEYYSGNIPWLRTQEVDWKEIYNTEIKITEEAIEKSSAKIIPANCVIVAMYGATAAKVAINRIPLSTNQACCNLEIDTNQVEIKYVYQWLCKEYLNLKALGEGSQNNINGKKVKDYPIPIPTREAQHRIVTILDQFEASIANLEAQLKEREKQYEYYRNQLLTFE